MIVETEIFGKLPVINTLRRCELLDVKSYRGILDDGTVVTVRSERPVERQAHVTVMRDNHTPAGVWLLKWKRKK